MKLKRTATKATLMGAMSIAAAGFGAGLAHADPPFPTPPPWPVPSSGIRNSTRGVFGGTVASRRCNHSVFSPGAIAPARMPRCRWRALPVRAVAPQRCRQREPPPLWRESPGE